MALNVNVEVRRTINTPKGRKFPPREPKAFILTMAPKEQQNPGAADDQYGALERKMNENFPGLQGNFMLYWKDCQGELLPCDNNEQLMQALDSMTSETLQLFVQRKQNGRCNMVINISQCSECHEDIKGLRTKCLQCPDYNLCTDCDLKGYHDNHVMVRCARPRFFNFALPWFNAVIPQFCEEILEKNKDKPVPRISPMDIRQFWQKQKKQAARSESDGAATEDTDCQRGHHNRRRQMKRMWHGFLANIAVQGDPNDVSRHRPCEANPRKQPVHQKCPSPACPNQDSGTGEEAGDLAEKMNEMDLEESRNVQEMRPRLQQLKRQWMQKSIQQWRQQMHKGFENKDNEDKTKMSFGMWRPFMRNRWDHWQQLSSAEGIAPKDCPWMRRHHQGPESQGDKSSDRHQCPVNPRRQWIQSCWKMWRDEAGKMVQTESSSDDDCTMAKKSPRRHGGPPFHGCRILMNKSWRLMLEQLNANQQDDKQSHETPCIGKSNPEIGQTIEGEHAQELSKEKLNPEMAKQMLKMCWINGCRQIWWMQVNNLNLKENEKTAENTGAEKKEKELKQNEVFNAMMKQPKWRAYMQQCWVLWCQLCKRAGLAVEKRASVNESKGSDGETEMDVDSTATTPEAQKMKAKQAWLMDTWKLCQEDIVKIRPHQRGDESPKWDKRPFFGWRPLVLKSWNMMQTYLTPVTPTEAWEDMAVKKMQSMRDRWMRKNKNQMEDDNSSDGIQKDKPTNSQGSDAGPSHTSMTWQEEREQLLQNLIDQYWHMLIKRENMKQHRSANMSCHMGWRRHCHAHKKARIDQGCMAVKCAASSNSVVEGQNGCNHGPRLRLKLSMRQKPTEKE